MSDDDDLIRIDPYVSKDKPIIKNLLFCKKCPHYSELEKDVQGRRMLSHECGVPDHGTANKSFRRIGVTDERGMFSTKRTLGGRVSPTKPPEFITHILIHRTFEMVAPETCPFRLEMLLEPTWM